MRSGRGAGCFSGVSGSLKRTFSERRAFLLQKFQLFRRTVAAEYGVAVRIAAEAAADGFVKFVAFGEPEGAVFFGEPKIEYGLRGNI